MMAPAWRRQGERDLLSVPGRGDWMIERCRPADSPGRDWALWERKEGLSLSLVGHYRLRQAAEDNAGWRLACDVSCRPQTLRDLLVRSAVQRREGVVAGRIALGGSPPAVIITHLDLDHCALNHVELCSASLRRGRADERTLAQLLTDALEEPDLLGVAIDYCTDGGFAHLLGDLWRCRDFATTAAAILPFGIWPSS